MRLFENPILIRVMHQQWKFGRICLAIIVQSVLLLVICQLLLHAKLGRFTDLIFLSEALVVLVVAPYLACRGLSKHLGVVPATDVLRLSPIFSRRIWASVMLGSQIYTFCFVGLATFVLPF